MLKLNKATLNKLHLDELRTRYPTFPYLPEPKYTDTTANGLTKCIKDFLNYCGHQSERISTTGRQVDNRKATTDVIGRARTVGSTKYIPGTGTNGSADISATIFGKSVKIEVKIGKDRQSADQKKYQQAIESAGGLYWIAKDYDGFIEDYRKFIAEQRTIHTSAKGVEFIIISHASKTVQFIKDLSIMQLTESQLKNYHL